MRWKVFYFLLSATVFSVFVIAPGMEGNLTNDGNETSVGNSTRFSNYSSSGSLFIAESWTSRESAQSLAVLFVPTICTLRVTYLRGLLFVKEDLNRVLTKPSERYHNLNIVNESAAGNDSAT